MRLPLLAALLCFARAAHAADTPALPANATAGLNATADPASRWAAWLAGEHVAHRYARTRAELDVFGAKCAYLAPRWAALADAHASLGRVIVLDARHNFNGLGDSHERWNFLLRVARSLPGRAAFLWADECADPDGPRRARVEGVPGPVRPPGCQFDPGAFVSGFGGVDWRWSAAARRRVQAAQGPGARETALQYQCLKEGHRGCLHAVLRWAANGTEVLRAEGAAGDDTAGPVLAFLHSERIAALPWLRLETSVQGDLTREAFSEVACTAGAGHLERKPECSQACESFANWRPRPRTWAALRPSLLAMDGWAAAAAVTVRTGAADHFGALPRVLRAPPPASAAALAERIGAMFVPCGADAPAFKRSRKRGEAPCVHWRSDDATAPTPDAELALQCAGMPPPMDAAAAAAAAAADAEAAPLFNVTGGSFGAFLACAARGAAALATADGTPGRWGIVLFSDAPGLKCIVESSALAAAGHVLSTPSVPGHIQYAPAGPLLRTVGLSAVTDWYLLGLVDISLPVFGSAFSGAASVRGFRGHRAPPGAPQPGLRRGFERWFEAGRENHGVAGADEETLALLAGTHDGCPVQQRSVRDVAYLYAGEPAPRAGEEEGEKAAEAAAHTNAKRSRAAA
jgi:hypothetical protein